MAEDKTACGFVDDWDDPNKPMTKEWLESLGFSPEQVSELVEDIRKFWAERE